MAKSMTGFGRGRASNRQMTITVEIKSLNNRYCEIAVRLPRFFNALEPDLRTQCRAFVQRGKLDCAVTVELARGAGGTVSVDVERATAYDRALHELGQSLGVPAQRDLHFLATLPDVLRVEEYRPDLSASGALLRQATAEALQNLVEMRRAEGAKLTADILAGCRQMVVLSRQLQPLADQVPELYREKLTERLQRFRTEEVDLPVAADRLAVEVALLADKADVHEELVRLSGHLTEMENLVQKDEPVGKKLDFYCQEVNREVNTIGSKANDGGMTQLVIQLKAVLETVREQVQNLE